MRADAEVVRAQERAAVEALYPSRRTVIATPINPPVKGLRDDIDDRSRAGQRGQQQRPSEP